MQRSIAVTDEVACCYNGLLLSDSLPVGIARLIDTNACPRQPISNGSIVDRSGIRQEKAPTTDAGISRCAPTGQEMMVTTTVDEKAAPAAHLIKRVVYAIVYHVFS